ncbi:MAG: lamin tail domain-containing protein, partial [Planctomycetota bacterium]
MKITKFEKLIALVAAFLVGSLIQVTDAGWIAYNDCIRQIGDSTTSNVTDWTIYSGYTDHNTGILLDFATGSDVGMPTVVFTMNSSVPVNTHIDYGDNFAVSTPAHTVFDQKVDFSGTILQHSSSTGWWVEIEFTGLDPTRKYSFVGTAVRISPSDLDRISLLTIKDAVSYVNNSGYHTEGDSGWVGTDTTKFLAVGNATEGVVVRWDDIEPGADGDFTVRAEADSSLGSHGRRAYPLAGFMLEELGPAGNSEPEVDAGTDQETTLPDNTVNLNGTVDDDGLGEPNGFLALTWSKISGPGEVTFEPNEFVEDPTAIFEPLAHGTYVLQLEATDGELSASDVVTVTVNESICPPGDLTLDCIVNWADVKVLAGQWLLPNGSANLDGKNGVGMGDFAWLAQDWQENRQRGSLRVTIEPQGAVDDGAQWRVDSGTWRDSRYTQGDLTVGTHTIEFSSVTGWGQPGNQQVQVDYAQTTSTSGTYIQQTGSLQVIIYPQEAIDTGAKWRVDSGIWRSSGDTVSGLSVGLHTVDYNSVNGWIKPPNQQIQIYQSLPTITSGTYQGLGGTPVVINEFMAVNSYVPFINPTFNMYTEVYGFDVHPDWIELHNMDPANTIDLDGWYLTNDPEILTKWQFPSGESIGPNGYYVLFASGKKQEDNPGNYPFRDGDGALHTNFMLGSGGDYLALVEPNGVTISHEYAPDYPEQRGFVSYGISSGGYGYLVTPTPGSRVTGKWSGAANSAKYDGAVEDTEFNRDRGFYYSAFNVAISCATPGATIRYTLNGSEPTMTNGSTYNTPIIIDTTTCLRAAAFKSNWLPSNVDTQTYIFPAHVIVQTNAQAIAAGYPSYWGYGGDYEMDPEIYNDPAYSGVIQGALLTIPALSVVMDKNHLFGGSGIYTNPTQKGMSWERPTSAEFFDTNGVKKFQVNCGIRVQGGASRNPAKAPKHSLSLRFRGGYGPGELDCELFDTSPVDRFNSLQIRAMYNNSWIHWDNGQRSRGSMIRDQWVRDSLLDMGDPGGGYGTYVHLYLNGLYWGVYNVHERPDAEHYASHYDGSDDKLDALNSGSAVDGTASSWNNLHTLLANAVAGGISLSEYQQIQQKLDFVNLIDYMMVNHYGENSDWDGHNWRAAGGGIDDMPWRIFSWDAERVLENVSEDRTGQNSSGDPSRLFHNMLYSSEFKMLVADRMHKHLFNDGALMAENTAARWMRRANELDLAIICESARWGDYRRDVHQSSNGPYLLYTKNDHWLPEQNRLMNDYFPERAKNPLNTNNLLQQYKDRGWYPSVEAPVFDPHGGWNFTGFNVTITNPNGSGVIWYTTNGEDPRLPGGATNLAHATTYSVPLNLSKSTKLKARVLDGTTWSALNEAVYGVGPVAEDLRITEIMYHPKNTGNPGDPNEEYIELKNIGTSTLNLNLVGFTEGIDFTFPDMDLDPDECVVVVKENSAFEAQYGASVNVTGEYKGSLANNGEGIKLVDAIGRTILEFEYEDGWHPITDGQGFSLTIIDPANTTQFGPELGLDAHWKFDDETGSSIATDSAGTNNGTLNGDPTWTTGRFDGALSFDGNGDYVSFASNDALASESVTVQAWIRLSEFAGMYNPIMIQHLGRDGYYLYVTSYRPSFYLIGGGGIASALAISPETIETEKWYHVAGTNDGTDIKLYIDGNLKATSPSTGFLGFDYNAYIGCEPAYSFYYTGLIDDVRIYNRPLGEHEFEDIVDPTLRWSQKDSWRASVYRNGTPGADDSGILPNPGAVVINEVMSHSNNGPDWIELYNTTSESINIGGWFLSDNNRDEPNLMKYRIANGTMINDNSYLVFYQDTDFNNPSDPGCLVPFALSENGEKACLSSHLDPNSMLTGYRAVEDFGPSATNVSFGRYFKSSTNNFNFVAMDSNTPGGSNANPRVGPVVINEIMYNPPTGNQKEEYIELYNTTATAVTLWRIDKNSSWKFTDGIDLT